MDRKAKKEYTKELEERFEIFTIPDGLVAHQLLVDRETGIEYWLSSQGVLSPLLTSDGQPKINQAFKDSRL